MITDSLLQNQQWTKYFQSRKMDQVLKKHQTPFYFYDAEILVEKYHSLFQAIQYPGLKIFYAMKANYNVALLRILKDLGAGVDTVSPTELILAEKIGFSPDKIIFTANNMTDQEMHFIAKKGILFNIGSLSRLKKFGQAYPGRAVCLRFNPNIIAGAHEKIQTGGNKSKFGILLTDVGKAVDICKQYQLKVIGLHEHTGSGIEYTDQVLESMKNLLRLVQKQYFPQLEFVDFGGGFKVPYHPDEKSIDYHLFGKNISEIFQQACSQYGKDLALYFEPGKYLTAECGFLIVQVNTLKSNEERTFAGVNSGFGHLIRPSYYNAYHHIVNLSNPHGEIKKYDVCGQICETGDCFARDRAVNQIREGDYLAFFTTGAYCFAMASIYNLRPLPSEILYSQGQTKLITKELTANELAEQILRRSICL
ncbi:MAG: diaminopimelate decarboxylase [Spirochaetes bacterium]|nr:diaminopimelate decarboxylase [Spirochaetota bacterium]